MPSALSESSSVSTVSATLVIVFLILAILVGVKWYLFVVLICVSLMLNGVRRLFTCTLAIWISSLSILNVYADPLTVFFFNWAICFLLLSCKDHGRY